MLLTDKLKKMEDFTDNEQRIATFVLENLSDIPSIYIEDRSVFVIEECVVPDDYS